MGMVRRAAAAAAWQWHADGGEAFAAQCVCSSPPACALLQPARAAAAAGRLPALFAWVLPAAHWPAWRHTDGVGAARRAHGGGRLPARVAAQLCHASAVASALATPSCSKPTSPPVRPHHRYPTESDQRFPRPASWPSLRRQAQLLLAAPAPQQRPRGWLPLPPLVALGLLVLMVLSLLPHLPALGLEPAAAAASSHGGAAGGARPPWGGLPQTAAPLPSPPGWPPGWPHLRPAAAPLPAAAGAVPGAATAGASGRGWRGPGRERPCCAPSAGGACMGREGKRAPTGGPAGQASTGGMAGMQPPPLQLHVAAPMAPAASRAGAAVQRAGAVVQNMQSIPPAP